MRDSLGCDVARKATWQRHAGPRGAYAARCDMCNIDIYRKYMVYSTYKPSDYRKYANLINRHLLYTGCFPLIFSVWD